MNNPYRAAFAAAAVLAVALAFAAPATAADTKPGKSVPWGYGPKDGPKKWGALSPAYRICATGKRQSPINLPARVRLAKSDLRIAYAPGRGSIVNNGHTLQVDMAKSDMAKGSSITLAGKRYALVQFHFHTPSETKIAGRAYPMELHLVHQSADGKLAVIGVMIVGGGTGNTLIDKLPLPAKSGMRRNLGTLSIDPATLLPKNRLRYRFAGSLTTPPCSEGVSWIMMRWPIRVATKTIRRFRAIMGHNARPVLPRHGRAITAAR
jgi:carbonic anhydrase